MCVWSNWKNLNVIIHIATLDLLFFFKGDASEFAAIQKVFGHHLPMLTTNKWKIGHTFGSSGILSVELALLMLQHQQFIGVPFSSVQPVQRPLNVILVNAVGFGGNAVSVLLRRA